MKKRIFAALAVLILVMSLSLVGSAGATTAGFNVNCRGVSGFGSVPEGDTYRWRIWYLDPPHGVSQFWSGAVAGGQTFDPAILWPTPPSGGSGENDSYYWWWIWSDVAGRDVFQGEGHFTCFRVDCTGAFGFGDVPEGDTYRWRIWYLDPPHGVSQFWSGAVAGGQTFDPAILWPAPPSGGSGENDSYYWWWIWSDVAGRDAFLDEGHFTCP